MGATFGQRLDLIVDEIKALKIERDEIELAWFRTIQKGNGCLDRPPCRSPFPKGIYCGCAEELRTLQIEAKP